MTPNLDELAQRIVALDRTAQEALLEKVAELNFQRGLEALARKYRERLAREGKLDQSTADLMAELEQVREALAAHDYQN
jgi:hypothetical protein